MKEGDLVQINPAGGGEVYALRRAQKHFMKIGVIVSFTERQREIHPDFRLWQVMVEGKVIELQGMDLVVLSETG